MNIPIDANIEEVTAFAINDRVTSIGKKGTIIKIGEKNNQWVTVRWDDPEQARDEQCSFMDDSEHVTELEHLAE